MPAKTYTCALCKETVSRRKSLSLEVLGAGDGRACRKHPEVVELVRALEEQRQVEWQRQEEQRSMNETFYKLRVMSAASMCRSLHTVRGLDPETFYARLRLAGYPHNMINDIRDEVDRLGGPLMDEQETLTAVVGAMALRRKGLV